MTHRRRSQRRREVADDIYTRTVADDSASQEETLIAQELSAAFAQVVGELTEDDRASLGLHDGATALSGATHRERKQRAPAGHLEACLW